MGIFLRAARACADVGGRGRWDIEGVIQHEGGHMQYTCESAVVCNPPSDGGRPRLLDEVRRRLRVKRYSLRTEQA